MMLFPRTLRALEALWALDRSFVGTRDYMGYAYFWNIHYRYPLRHATCTQRQRVHDALLEAGLALNGATPEHAAVIRKVLRRSPRLVQEVPDYDPPEPIADRTLGD